MKRIFQQTLVLFFLFLSLTLSAQDVPVEDQPMIDNRSVVNVFGGMLAEPSLFNQEVALSMGATMGLTYLDHFYLGGYYVALVSQHYRNDIEQHYGTRVRGSFNHGGLIAGYVWKPQSLMNLNFSLRAGWGSIWYFDPTITNSDRLNDLYGGTKDRIFALTPEVEYTFTPLTWMRVGIGWGYRIVLGLDRYPSADYDSPVGIVTVSFGSFKNKPADKPIDETETEGNPQP